MFFDGMGFTVGMAMGMVLGLGEVVLCSQVIHRGVTASLSCLAVVLALGLAREPLKQSWQDNMKKQMGTRQTGYN